MRKNIHKTKIIISMFIFVLLFGLNLGVVSAQNSMGGGTGAGSMGGGTGANTPVVRLTNPIAATNVQDLMLKIADIAIFIGTMFAVLMFFWVGFKFVMSRGDPKEVGAAKEMFKAVVIGTAILISSKVIVETIKNTLVSSGVVDKSIFELPKNNP